MKTKDPKKNEKQKKARLNFVRAFPFYIRLGDQAYSFQVVISSFRPLDPRTGMSVNLVLLNQIAEKILSRKPKSPKTNLENELNERVRLIKKELAQNKTELVTIQFDECRGFSILFEKDEFIFIRRDFATDKSGDLYAVTSYFNRRDELLKMKLVNLKLGLEELISYS